MLLQKIDGSEVCCKKEVCSSLLKLVVAFIVVKWEKQEKRTERETSLLCLPNIKLGTHSLYRERHQVYIRESTSMLQQNQKTSSLDIVHP